MHGYNHLYDKETHKKDFLIMVAGQNFWSFI